MSYKVNKLFSESEWNQLTPDQINKFMIDELTDGIRKEITKYVNVKQVWNATEPGIKVTASVDITVGPELKSANIDPFYDTGALDIHKLLRKQLDELQIDKLKRDLGYDFDEPFPNLNEFIADEKAKVVNNSFNPGRINNTSLDALINTTQVHHDIENGKYWIRGEDEMIDVTELVEDLRRKQGNGF